MSGERDTKVYLDDILDVARKAMGFAEGLSFEEFVEDDRTTFAVVRALEILGEAAKNVPPETREMGDDAQCVVSLGCRWRDAG